MSEAAGFGLHSEGLPITDQEFSMFNRPGTLWSEYRDTSLSWLALGVLLAAWNACDDDPRPHAIARPDILRDYPVVSRRALCSTQARQVVATLAPPLECRDGMQ